MAHSKQALKRARQSDRIRVKNKADRSAMKSQLKRVETAITAADAKAVAVELAAAQKRLDKAAKNRIIHPNAAARAKSRLARAAAAALAKRA